MDRGGRGIGLNAKVEQDAIAIDFRIRTNPDGLTEADLPIAPGDEAPPIIDRPGEIGVGVRDIGQIVGFVETVAQAVAPSDYGDYSAAKTQLERQLGVDVEKDILDQLSGDISASISLKGKFGVRVEPKDPAAFDKTLGKLAGTLPTLAEALGLDDASLVRPKGGEDFYALATPGGDSIVFGVKNGVFVITNDPGRADDLALDEPSPATGQQGSVVARTDGEQLALCCSRTWATRCRSRSSCVRRSSRRSATSPGRSGRTPAASPASSSWRSTSSRRAKLRPRPLTG